MSVGGYWRGEFVIIFVIILWVVFYVYVDLVLGFELIVCFVKFF